MAGAIKQTAQLKNWHEYCGHIYGEVYGHPRFEDGTRVITSSIVSQRETDTAIIIETRNTIYTCNVEDEIGGMIWND